MLTIVATEDGYALEGGGLQTTAIRINGKPASLGSGWIAASASKLANTVIAVNLKHLDGREATWLLDLDGSYLSGSIEALPEDRRGEFLDKAKRWLDAVAWDFLHAPGFAERGDLLQFFDVAQDIRDDLIRRLGLPEFAMPEAVVVKDDEATGIRTVLGTTSLSPKHVRTCIETPIDDRFVAACRTGRMSWTSPVDGAPVHNVRGFALSHILMAWRCVDERNSLVFFVIAAGFSSAALSLWIPSLRTIYGPAALGQGQFSVVNGPDYLTAVVRHLFQFGRDLIPFLRRPVSRVAHYTWPVPAVHVGHYHWNELPGLAKIVDRLDPGDYPIVFDLGGASGNCFYERTTKIYPELNRVIDLSCKDLDTMNRLAYRHGIQPIKFAGCFVSADIRARIARAVALHPTSAVAADAAAAARGPIIILGLRVENRTASNLVDFYVRLAERIADHYGAVMILVDGHNVKAEARTEAFISNQEQKAASKPIEVERQMVAALQHRLRDDRITVVDCVGMTLRENLAWLQIAQFCVAPWGAGLAKYRWVLNTPSYVLANRYCMRHKNDMHIYSDGDSMQSPTRQEFISETLVEDQPDLPVLIDIGGNYKPYCANFKVDIEAAIVRTLEQMDSRTESATPAM